MTKTSDKDTNLEALNHTQRAYAGKLFPTEQIETFRNIDRMFPTRIIERGGTVKPLQKHQKPILDLPISSNGQTYDLFDYVARNRVTGLLMLKDSKIALEQYEYGNTASTRWMSMSMAKSISTTLVGAAIQDGFIHSVNDPLTAYIPKLISTSYDGVSIKELLQMTSGVEWNEDQTNPNSERRKVLDLQIAQEPGAIVNFMAALPRVAKPGTRFNYSTGETHMVGALLKAATGKNLADYLSRRIWSKLGMESDATWWLEAPGGLEIAGSGISATLRDYARFAMFIMDGGLIDGERILPEGWVEEATTPRMIDGALVNYGYMWWPLPAQEGLNHSPGFSARGIFGQYIYINPEEKIVLVVWSARAKPVHSEVIPDNDFFLAAVKALNALYT
ncbi:serine hydrolase domain-containing protein [Kordiimonas pumila]|uniref:Serine hydrolase domain-containing protein n=1 Tax=Kordiimonas pumila TaxID=2161677 RepID=A0ABV7D9I3_9PROT|nr:serine hydrolase [Kordiimonas pumila]